MLIRYQHRLKAIALWLAVVLAAACAVRRTPPHLPYCERPKTVRPLYPLRDLQQMAVRKLWRKEAEG